MVKNQGYREKLVERVNWTTDQQGNTIFLEHQVSVTLLCTLCFSYSRLSVIDELCVRRFHFILLVIQLDAGVVIFLDSSCKEPKEARGEWKKEL